VATRKRRTSARSPSRGGSGSRSSGSRGSTARRRTRRRPSTGSTLGTAAGVALAGVLIALLGGLPWWEWTLLVVVGLAVLAAWALRRRRAAPGSLPAGVRCARPCHELDTTAVSR